MSSKTDFKFSTHTPNWIWNFRVHILQQQQNQRVQQKRNTDEEQTQTTKTLIKLTDICMMHQTEPAGYSSISGGTKCTARCRKGETMAGNARSHWGLSNAIRRHRRRDTRSAGGHCADHQGRRRRGSRCSPGCQRVPCRRPWSRPGRRRAPPRPSGRRARTRKPAGPPIASVALRAGTVTCGLSMAR